MALSVHAPTVNSDRVSGACASVDPFNLSSEGCVPPVTVRSTPDRTILSFCGFVRLRVAQAITVSLGLSPFRPCFVPKIVHDGGAWWPGLVRAKLARCLSKRYAIGRNVA